MAHCIKCKQPILYNKFRIDKDNQVWCSACWNARPKPAKRKYIRRKKQFKENFEDESWKQNK